MDRTDHSTRREFLAATAAGVAGVSIAPRAKAGEGDQALIAITLDLEMSRNFPDRSDTHWDFEKGNLDDRAKSYAVEACRRVKAAGGVLHCFAVGRVLEQEDVSWLEGIVRAGHPVGNHTYDHANVLATRAEDIQFRFRRAPWLIEGRTPAEVIRDNVRLATSAMKSRLNCEPAGFRTPGGFHDGLRDRPDVRAMLREQGFGWVSSLYPPHEAPRPLEEPEPAVFDSILRAQAQAQPFVYPDGLVEIPMSPISDIGAFRTGRWQLEWFLKAVRLGVEWAIEHRAVYDFLGHPSCLYVTDPEFRAIELICDLARRAGDRAALVGLESIAERARKRER
ncbi:polysaccharide deacetylase family protein [Tundrisphaera lichenicola]|uniref:polysaccharide deacetylase family protein n=1 Tax=Tundrisphaera lichenicola TaxID=2029860 RepID=UPI003EB8A7F7